jgi:hypothetical protein
MRAMLLASILCAACSADASKPRPACVDLAATCAPLYEPRFDEIHKRTLLPTCAQGGASCHSDEGKRGGLALEDIDGAYTSLVDGGRVTAGDASCSEMIVRTHLGGEDWSMPPRRPLSPEERCVLRLWVEQGAAR